LTGLIGGSVNWAVLGRGLLNSYPENLGTKISTIIGGLRLLNDLYISSKSLWI